MTVIFHDYGGFTGEIRALAVEDVEVGLAEEKIGAAVPLIDVVHAAWDEERVSAPKARAFLRLPVTYLRAIGEVASMVWFHVLQFVVPLLAVLGRQYRLVNCKDLVTSLLKNG